MIKILQLFFERQPIKQIVFSQKIQCPNNQFNDVVDNSCNNNCCNNDNSSCNNKSNNKSNNEIKFIENNNNNDIIIFKTTQDDINNNNNDIYNNNDINSNNNNNNNITSTSINEYNSDESTSIVSTIKEVSSDYEDSFESISQESIKTPVISKAIEFPIQSNTKDNNLITIDKELPLESDLKNESPLSKTILIINPSVQDIKVENIQVKIELESEQSQSISTTNIESTIEIFESSNLPSNEIILDSPIQCSPLVNSIPSTLTTITASSISDSSTSNNLSLPNVALTVPLGSPSNITEIRSLSSSTTSITAAFNEFSRQLVESASPAILGSPIYYGPTSSNTSSFTSLPSFILPEQICSNINDDSNNNNNSNNNILSPSIHSTNLSSSVNPISKTKNNVPLLLLPNNINSISSPATSPKRIQQQEKENSQQYIPTPRPTILNNNNFINPPPPPPFKKINNNNKQSNNLPLPSINMKQLYWNKINNLKGTIFDSLQQQDNNVKLDISTFKDIEKVFSAKSSEKKDNGYSFFSPRKLSLIQIIDTKVSQNLSIFLSSQFKGISFSEICHDIQYGNELMFQLNHIDSLINFLQPMDEYINQINQFIKETNLLDIGKLGIAEQFLLAIYNTVPQVKSRLEIMKFKYTFEIKKKDLYSNINNIKQATKEIKSNEKISKIFQVILVLGNFMNSGTSRGNAYGFKLNTITKLADIKSTDNKISLLNYLSKVIIKDFPQLHCFSKDLSHVSYASRVAPLSELVIEVSNLEKDFKNVKQLIQSLDDQNSINQLFKQKYDAFCTHISKDIDLILNLSQSTEKEFKELLIVFGEDSKTETNSFFNIFNQFIEQYEKASKENDQYKKRNSIKENKNNSSKVGTSKS